MEREQPSSSSSLLGNLNTRQRMCTVVYRLLLLTLTNADNCLQILENPTAMKMVINFKLRCFDLVHMRACRVQRVFQTAIKSPTERGAACFFPLHSKELS